ncbi:glycosyltransferase family 4 protein [Acidithiobacillus sp. HP-6]|uniref:glycosyltransferase family 4 protein n=1 Tax=unclassified Acidithiobacillus TaxID=2614800 RepID=UPI00187A93D6|nr:MULTISPECIES: glycosyltransferase family 4 protein [unclassified Acidithiobacillus]MBE7561653.1 glycosyltransferase family 4 protein [Acidithiobacillus sp. HP-6]MBE7568433.1 glycosyltransferase family 4 protein [Acidithiobacillus sp. HP-2]
MKILFLHALADIDRGGGAEVIVWEQMRGLRAAGHDCVLLVTSDQAGLTRSEQDGITVWRAGIRNVYWPYQKKRPAALMRLLWHGLDSINPWMQDYLKDVLVQERPDVASLHNLSGWSAASLGTLAKFHVPIVQVLHDYYLICAKANMYNKEQNCTRQCATCRAFRLPHRNLSRRVQAVVGVSQFIIDRHRSLGYFDGVPIQRAIHNARALRTLGIEDAPTAPLHDGVRFGYIGRLDRSKGIEPLIAAFLQADIPGSELWIAGSGQQGYEQRLRGLIRDSRIRLLGRQRPAEFYPQVDLIVVPSLWNDNLPGVVFEAFAFGKPVIGARRGGIPEMIRDGYNGWLVEPTDISALANLMCSLHARRELLAAASYAARVSATPYTDLRTWVQRYEELYREAISIQRHALFDERP